MAVKNKFGDVQITIFDVIGRENLLQELEVAGVDPAVIEVWRQEDGTLEGLERLKEQQEQLSPREIKSIV